MYKAGSSNFMILDRVCAVWRGKGRTIIPGASKWKGRESVGSSGLGEEIEGRGSKSLISELLR